MKRFLLLTVMVCAFVAVQAQPPAGDANIGDTYGEKINAKKAISLAKLNKKFKKSETFTGQVTGKVNGVCTNRGCWLTMEMPDKTTMQVKFKDYGFFVPTALIGKNVVVSGEASKKTVPVEELKHLAEEAKKSPEEIAAITQPEKQVRFMANGVLVVK